MTWIYFALVDDSQIKIGKADDLAARMRQHERTTLSVHQIDLLAAVEGCAADERHVQRYFDDAAIVELLPNNGNPPEVFQPTPEVTNYIRWLRNQWFVVIEPNGNPEGKVSFETWEPSLDRQVPPASHPLFAPDWLEFNDRIITGDDYYTNTKVIDCARRVLGDIDLDPASHPLANKHVKAKRFYSIQDNGLEQKWGGRVWLNPPFSQWQLWVPKIHEEWQSGRVQAMCVYSAMRTITAQYFRALLDMADGMCIVTGRLKHGGRGGDSPNDGHCVFYLGDNISDFVEAFGPIGVVWVKP